MQSEWQGLLHLVRDLRLALGLAAVVTVDYYPDGRQEGLLAALDVAAHVDFMCAMSYDAGAWGVVLLAGLLKCGAGGPHGHSPVALAQQAMRAALSAGLPRAKVLIGVPFYGRVVETGDWRTWEDIVQRARPVADDQDSVANWDAPQQRIAFNGVGTISHKAALISSQGFGIMVWEAGQDCRVRAVVRDGRTHGVTCPDGERSSLIAAIQRTLAQREREL